MDLKYHLKRLFNRHSIDIELAPEATTNDVDIYKRVKPFTMTSPDRVWALINTVNYIIRGGIVGDFVECGVWRGGSAMAMCFKLNSLNIQDRHLWMYDTFSGMTNPSENDVEISTGNSAFKLMGKAIDKDEDNIICEASKEEVIFNMESTSYPMTNIHIIEGDVLKTLGKNSPDKISLLRLDTDWYESTCKELEVLFPKLVRGGVCIIDDYGHWKGSKKAVDEYLKDNCINVLLNKVDYTGRLFIKP